MKKKRNVEKPEVVNRKLKGNAQNINNLSGERNRNAKKSKAIKSVNDKSNLDDKIPDNDDSTCLIDVNDGRSNITTLENMCKICCKSLRNKRRMQEHRKTVHSNKILLCPNCNKQFSNRQYLRKHRTKVHSEKIMSCLQCSKYFPCVTYLQSHINTCHSTSNVTCTNCNKTFKHLYYLNDMKDCCIIDIICLAT